MLVRIRTFRWYRTKGAEADVSLKLTACPGWTVQRERCRSQQTTFRVCHVCLRCERWHAEVFGAHSPPVPSQMISMVAMMWMFHTMAVSLVH